MVLGYQTADEMLKCDHSNDCYRTVLFCGVVMLYKVVLTFESVDEIPKCYRSNESY